tara:strand:+ start:819 stop:1274 length:456 start_codon:yes stop_codon:yes gene_type:complete
MKLLLENWREYLVEEVKYGGILMIKPTPEVISQAKAVMAATDLPPEALPLPDGALHITLVHQNILRPYREKIKGMALPPEPEVIFEPELVVWTNESLGRKSWAVQVENQEDLRNYVNEVMELLDAESDPEPDRRYHMTMANLVGESGGSVA